MTAAHTGSQRGLCSGFFWPWYIWHCDCKGTGRLSICALSSRRATHWVGLSDPFPQLWIENSKTIWFLLSFWVQFLDQNWFKSIGFVLDILIVFDSCPGHWVLPKHWELARMCSIMCFRQTCSQFRKRPAAEVPSVFCHFLLFQRNRNLLLTISRIL